MLDFLKRDKDPLESEKTKPDVSGVAAKELHEFIPYSAHFDHDTIITKNGELLKIIKIDSNNFGLNYESAQEDQHTVRETIRRAITSTIKTDQFSFWIHTMRRRQPITHEGAYEEEATAYVYDKWKTKHDWKYQYYNEIYITILHDGQDAKLFHKTDLKHVMLPGKNKAFRGQYLQDSYQALTETTDEIVEKIRAHYDAKLLRLIERLPNDMPDIGGTPIFYSEPMEMLGKLCNFVTQPYPLNRKSMDKALSNYEITFGYNAVENKLVDGSKRFAGLLSLKQYVETPSQTVDRILQLPVEMIVTHAFHYIPPNAAIKPLRDQKRMFEMSEDIYSIEHTGLHQFLKANNQSPTDYGKQQTSIMVLTDDYKQLDVDLSKVQQVFAGLGLIAVREDIKLEECYWAQLPGNFEFLRRQSIVTSKQMAGLSRLNLFPNGTQHDNHWGDAVALMPTIVNSPYFFNFHYNDNGHTVLFDFNSFQDQLADATLGLLITLCSKYKPNLYLFDNIQNSRLYVDRFGGKYHIFDSPSYKDTITSLNPFSLENNARNQSFLYAWCQSLIAPHISVSEDQQALLKQAVTALYEGAEHERNLAGLIHYIEQQDAALAESFSAFRTGGKYAGLFDATHDQLDLQSAMHAFDMSYKLKENNVAIPLFSYLMHRIISNLDGTPTIIVLHNAWSLLENEFFAPRLESLLEMLKQNNVMVICTTKNPSETVGTQTLQTLMQSCATKLYIPDEINLDYTSEALGLSKHDSDTLRRMDRQRVDFLVKQGNETIGLRASFENMYDMRAIFSNDIKNLIAAGGPYASLPEYYT